MPSPADRRYSKEHEWVLVDGGTGTVGITDYAQDQLGDIVFVELPAPGSAVKYMEKFGEIESVKAVSELFSPVSGEVVAANEELATAPEPALELAAAEATLEAAPAEAGTKEGGAQ